jgi:hypothetical protein
MARYQPVRRTRRGIELSLRTEERELIGVLISEMRALLDTDDPSLRRLFPTAYRNDPERDAEYQILARSELQDRRLSSLDVVEATLGASQLNEEQAVSWMHVINQIRLVLGTRLDVGEEDHEFNPDAPDALHRSVYLFLGMLLEEFVTAM